MDFMNRNVHPVQATRANGPSAAHNAAPGSGQLGVGKLKEYEERERFGRIFTVGSVALLVSIAILIGAVASYFAFGNAGNESQYINKNEYQAVFVNVNGTSGGQVYFGHIQNMTSDYVDLTNVFYIQNQSSSSKTSSNSYTLVKLGCELHAPEDQMVVNRSQVYFWENLKNNGQVAQKIKQWYQQNPNGQNCSQSSSSTSTDQSSTSTQNSTNTGTNPTNNTSASSSNSSSTPPTTSSTTSNSSSTSTKR